MHEHAAGTRRGLWELSSKDVSMCAPDLRLPLMSLPCFHDAHPQKSARFVDVQTCHVRTGQQSCALLKQERSRGGWRKVATVFRMKLPELSMRGKVALVYVQVKKIRRRCIMCAHGSPFQSSRISFTCQRLTPCESYFICGGDRQDVQLMS
jgi:hypothetical protein